MIQISKGDITSFPVVSALVDPELGCFKLEIARPFERKVTFLLVASAFEWIVAQPHQIYCMHKNGYCQFLCVQYLWMI